jgi:RNA polymerase sigma-70 factor, ECF subfamily
VSVASAHVDPDWARLRAHVRAMLGRRLANGADAEDVVQEVLLRVFRGTNNLRDGDRFGSWLATMVRNAVADHLRARRRHPLVTGDGADIAEREPDESDDAARKSLITVLRPFVARLPAIYRDVITLSELDDVPHAEIARRLSISVSGVKSRVQRGREQLHKMLTDCCQIALDARGGVVDCVPRAETAAAGCCAPGDGTPASKPADAAS